MAEVTQQQKQVLFAFLFDSFPEISDKYNKASKEEKARARKKNTEFLNRICGTRK
jgi:hypothetical protein